MSLGPPNYGPWHPWLAWRPVRTVWHGWRWLCATERRMCRHRATYGWDYRPKEAE